ncbi:type III polyketide synthase [Bacillus sp. ISL-40]|uniref:type III polyketide synthase n=1 Tax=unclassified Bacillus (in: firmicutes) TaxID=185979 RepID=UPI001BE6137B|nr:MULTISPECIES: 3-oxoacyl-[acyl-carrier-protein] synthase III C-terminal domain-containing protein [unclassified Bacillus (in: firmicutes)]MBT2699360.1 type III polyketide synthase [Bacillus sp. ISL-40]MBT2723372.1 type III polyketide synthase [Bacillus sp. ISL-46]MBT2739780.1 type III polyketide synthase [Bacillus sp. ISL-77]
MPTIISVAEVTPHFEVNQNQALEFARELFSDSFKDIERLLRAFQNGQIEKRHFVKNLDWFKEEHTFEEKNSAYIESALTLGKEAIEKCLNNKDFLNRNINYQEIDIIFFISTTGMATPSIEARIMNHLPFNSHTKRVPIWGLGCAGGAAGLSRAYEYCLAFPKAKALVLSVELCSLTFQRNDLSKSNLIGTSLFADGVACALVCGDDSYSSDFRKKQTSPSIIATQSTLMPNSLDVMGWAIRSTGLFVVFSRDIPQIIEDWLKPNVSGFLGEHQINLEQIDYFIAHPGGKKVIDAYVKSLELPPSMTDVSLEVLKQFGNMSSTTIFYVLKRYMEMDIPQDALGLGTALGPGFSSELLLFRWE